MKIQDDSGDKKYFTIIPNYIANHSTANDQALYFQMKRFAGEKGICFASETLLREKLGIGRKALKRSIKYLLMHGWVKNIGLKPVETKGGKQDIAVYSITDIWSLNTNYYKGVSKRTYPSNQGVFQMTSRGVQKDSKGVAERASNKNHIKKNQEEDVFIETDKSKEIIESVYTKLGKTRKP